MALLIFIALADAGARPFEFNTREFIKANNDLIGYKLREGENSNLLGSFSDDTQMSLGIAEALLQDTLPMSQEDYAEWFVRVYHRDPHGGYSRRVKNALELASKVYINPLSDREQARLFLEEVNPKGAPGNGTVMRTLPIGLLSDPDEVIRQSILHASATHGTIASMEATSLIAITAHWYYHLYDKNANINESKQAYFTWITRMLGYGAVDNIMNRSWDGTGEVPCEARATAAAALALVWEYSKMSEMLRAAVNLGGDVDSVAAVAIGLAALRGTENDLPKELYDGLENGAYGRAYLETIDRMLFKKFPKNFTNNER